jgi:antitoxin VapB
MGLSIKNDEIEQLVRTLAARRGVGVSAAVRLAVSNELAKDPPPKKDPAKVLAAIKEIQERVAKLPVYMTVEEIDAWMYDENGLPH